MAINNNVIVQYYGGFLPDNFTVDPSPYFCKVRWQYFITTTLSFVFKEKQNAPRPSEHPPVRGEKCQNV